MPPTKEAIPYSVVYSKRKTISIIVERDRSVVVRAPIDTPIGTIDELMEKKRQLLRKKISNTQKYPLQHTPKEFVSGESLLYLGNHFKLHVVEENFPGVQFDAKFFISSINQPQANSLFKKWYLHMADEVIVPKAALLAKQLGVTYKKLDIRELKYRWGSCTPKDHIHLNWRLIKAPVYVIEYIIIHELTHLLETNHTPEFWNRVAAQQPGYENAREWLKVNGAELERDF
jgi:predicted metal-dependent hydrolase